MIRNMYLVMLYFDSFCSMDQFFFIKARFRELQDVNRASLARADGKDEK